MANQTEIINIKVQHIRPMYTNLKEWMEDKDNIYIGRAGIIFIDGQRFPKQPSIWANPFKVQNNRNETVIHLYEKYIRNKIENEYGIEELLKLKGKTLGCWCKPKSCHGDILIKLIKEYSYDDDSNYESDNQPVPICLCCDENEIETRCNFCEEKICTECSIYCTNCNTKCCPVCISTLNLCEICLQNN
jgi:hypothetical protein